jgi:hypothetical protein
MTNGTSASLPKYNSFYRTWEPRIGCDASTQSRRQIGCRGLLAGSGLLWCVAAATTSVHHKDIFVVITVLCIVSFLTGLVGFFCAGRQKNRALSARFGRTITALHGPPIGMRQIPQYEGWCRRRGFQPMIQDPAHSSEHE